MAHRRLLLASALVATLAATPVGVGAEGEPASTVVPEATPTPIPVVAVPEITARIEETDALLRRLERLVTTPPVVTSILERLPELAKSIEERKDDPERLLTQGAPPRVIEYLNSTWQGMRDELTAWGKELTKRAVDLESAIGELSAQRDLWAASRAEAATSQAPPELLKRIDATVASVKEVQDKLADQRKQTLVLQSRVAAEVGPTDKILAELAAARLARVGRTLERDSPSLLGMGRPPGLAAVAAEVRDLARYKLAEARDWIAGSRGSVLAQGLALLGLGLLLRAAGRRREMLGAPGPDGDAVPGDGDAGDLARGTDDDAALAAPGARVLRMPWASAIVLVVVAVRLHGQLPELLDQATTFLVLPAAARLLLALAPPGFAPVILGFVAFVLADTVRGSLLAVPDVERFWLIAELIAASACLGAFAFGRSERMDRWRAALRVPRVRHLAMVALAVCLVALVAAVSGWMELARLLGSAVLSTIALAVVFRLVAGILKGVVGIALRVPPIVSLKAVRHQRRLIEQRLGQAIDLASVAAWGYAVLRNLAVGHLALEAAKALFEVRIGPGEMSLSIGDLLAFGLTILAAVLLSRLTRFLLEEEIYPSCELSRGIPFAISTVLHYAILGGGFVLALGALGLDLNRFTVLAGAFGVGIGFGLQNIVNNFVSGLILLFERPIQVGDEVQLGDLVGEVRDIGVRSSTVRTPRGADVIVPNGSLISERVTNWTRPDRLRRIDVVVSTPYGADPEKVIALLREEARTHPAVLADPPPAALLTRFAENTMWFELRAWTNRLEQVATVSSDLHLRVYRSLEGAGFLAGGK